MTHDGSTQARPLADDAARGMARLPLWAASLTHYLGPESSDRGERVPRAGA